MAHADPLYVRPACAVVGQRMAGPGVWPVDQSLLVLEGVADHALVTRRRSDLFGSEQDTARLLGGQSQADCYSHRMGDLRVERTVLQLCRGYPREIGRAH